MEASTSRLKRRETIKLVLKTRLKMQDMWKYRVTLLHMTNVTCTFMKEAFTLNDIYRFLDKHISPSRQLFSEGLAFQSNDSKTHSAPITTAGAKFLSAFSQVENVGALWNIKHQKHDLELSSSCKLTSSKKQRTFHLEKKQYLYPRFETRPKFSCFF